jgi:hypothetical protein
MHLSSCKKLETDLRDHNQQLTKKTLVAFLHPANFILGTLRGAVKSRGRLFRSIKRSLRQG